MLCINLTKLALVILWALTIFNFITIVVILFYTKGWNRTADKIYYQRRWGINDSSHYQDDNVINDIWERISSLTKILFKEEDKKN